MSVRFFGLTSEMTRLQAVDASASYAALKVTQYSGANEDCELGNNAASSQFRVLATPASTPGAGLAWFASTVAVTDHFSEFYLTSSSTPLPVELLSSTADPRGAAVALAWRTASEQHSDRFEVERSRDGRTFARIGTVPAQGTSSRPTDYAYRDAAAGEPALRYYRLRQLDTDGSVSYSPVRAVTVTGSGRLTLFPNPARTAVAVGGVPAGAPVAVFDALGRAVAHATADADGQARLTLPPGLAAGVYVVRSAGQVQRLLVD